ncbi:hypothetical protein RND81_06G171600 [Saponaria officinalis]|uniref:Uncharacterized protein n=1 Tax=Saponaria officinalis TaxID=3572 RepID=A0AAW1K7E4_SAPOF
MAIEVGTLLTIAEHLYNVIQSSALKEIRDYKSEMSKLIDTISSIKRVLLDADRTKHLTNEEHGWIEKLRDALYDANDLLDEFETIVVLKKDGVDGTLLNKVGDFFSFENPLIVAYRMRKMINEIRDKLDEITRNHKSFGWNSITNDLPRTGNCETGSHEYAQEVVGREDSVKAIVDKLRQFSDKKVSFLTIVGAGGVGKTTVARLVYRDAGVIKKFALRMWVSVNDHEHNKPFELEGIFRDMLESITKKDVKGAGINRLQEELEKELGGKTFMLVLDDVWTEDCLKWNELRSFLSIGGAGSAIVVTSRSGLDRKVKWNINYELQALTLENSWILFQNIAMDEERRKDKELVDIGKRIVKKCCDNPLAITVVGHLLSSKDLHEWRSFEDIELAGINEGDEIENKIISILKLSYHNLKPSLKSCFSYCALFQKDTQIGKDMIISLWIAQAYIVPFHRGQSIENAAEEYFSILLKRCFFQEVITDEYSDDVVSCKIHNLMHDVAIEVAKKEIYLRSSTPCTSNNYHHLYDNQSSYTEGFSKKTRIRSYLQSTWALSFPVDTLLANCVYLRALDLHGTGIETLPSSISRLRHLRYLDLSWNGFLRTLPSSITKLRNLQFLNLDGCYLFEELPKDLRRLVKLRYLNLNDCNKLLSMPSGMDRLIELRVLTTFIVSSNDPGKKNCVGQLEDLKKLVNLKGKIDIFIYGKEIKENDSEGGYLSNLRHLKEVSIHFLSSSSTSVDYERCLLEKMQPNLNLKGIRLLGYKGVSIPNLVKDNNNVNILPNIVKIELMFCDNLEDIPSLSNLQHLKLLRLRNLWNLEYMENTSLSSESLFFPSLEELEVHGMLKLKGWLRKDELNEINTLNKTEVSFPCLRKLIIEGCCELVSFPPCQSLDVLHLTRSNKSLRIKLVKVGIIRDLKIDDECYRYHEHFNNSNKTFQPFKRLYLFILFVFVVLICMSIRKFRV